MSHSVRRCLTKTLPALVLMAVVLVTVFGPKGLLKRSELAVDLARAQDNLAAIERTNQQLILQLSTMARDPVVIERAIADELEYASEGSTLYRFD